MKSTLFMVFMALLLVGACDPLPEISFQECGNHVVEYERGERCDSNDARCVPPGQPDQCHLRCDAYPGRLCPVGEVCSVNGACLPTVGVCGNHAVEDGEACDGEPGCIEPGDPGECLMRCSAYQDQRCPPQFLCDARGACTPAPGICGNTHLDPGEECDGTPGCVSAGQPGQCQLTCATHPGGHCGAGTICGPNGTCVAESGVCGNRRIEGDEDCDGELGCGAVDSPAACRFTCTDGASCPLGSLCGRDKICRRPTGKYRLGTPIGRGDEAFALIDVDRNGGSDLVARGPHRTTLYRNDETGTFTLYADGVTPPLPRGNAPLPDGLLPSPLVALSHDSDPPLLVALGPGAAALFRVRPPQSSGTAELQPFVTPTETIPEGIYVGTAGDAEVLRTDGANGPILTFRNPDFYGAYEDWPVTLYAACGVTGIETILDVRGTDISPSYLGHNTVTVVALIDRQHICFAEGEIDWEGPHLEFQRLEAAQVLSSLQERDYLPSYFDRIVLGDWNSDGLIDFACSQTSEGTSPQSNLLVWVRRSDGTIGDPYSVRGFYPAFTPTDPFLAADFNSDGREDLAIAGQVLLSRPPEPSSGGPYHDYFWHETTFSQPGAKPSDHLTMAAGDINGDGRPDIVISSTSLTDVTICRQPILNNVTISFACQDIPTGLARVEGLTVGDMNRDGRDDIVAFGRGTPANDSSSMIAYLSGFDVTAPVPSPTLLPAYHAQITSLHVRPAIANYPTTLITTLVTSEGDNCLSRILSDGVGALWTGIGGIFGDVRAGDVDQDGVPDLLLAGSPTVVLRGPVFDTRQWSGAVGTTGQSNAHFLDLPGNAWPVFASDVTFEVHDPATADDWTWYRPPLPGTPWTTKIVDTNGQGGSDIVIFNSNCDTYLASLPSGTEVSVRPLGQVPAAHRCEDISFVDVAPLDGVPDMLYEVRDRDDLSTHLVLARARADGTWDGAQAIADPLLVQGTAPFPPDTKILDQADLDGDGIPDLLLWTPDGAVIAFAEVVRK